MGDTKKTVISTEVTLNMKAEFSYWWKRENYASEAEALRYFVRTKTNTLTASEKQEAASNLGMQGDCSEG